MRWQILFVLSAVALTARARILDKLDEISGAEDEVNDLLESLDDLSDPNVLENIEKVNEKVENPNLKNVDIMPSPQENTNEDEEEKDIIEDEEEEENDEGKGGVMSGIEKANEKDDTTDTKETDIKELTETDEPDIEKRNALRDNRKLWHTRDIPFTWGTPLIVSYKPIIRQAMDTISNKSCIKFHEKTTQDTGTYINFKSASGCWSYVGRSFSSKQDVSIGNGCDHLGIVQHELLHALGFYHEQSRYDRDRYVEIKYENIKAGMEGNFRKSTVSKTRNLGTGYDYDSIMHYGKYGFSKNGKATIEVIGDPSRSIGQRAKMSTEDEVSLNRLYHCASTLGAADQWTDWSDYGNCHLITNNNDPCYKRKYRFCPTPNACTCETINGTSVCNEQRAACTDAECKVDGHWGHWGKWSACSATAPCIKGNQTRTRTCSNPAPLKGGLQCPGAKSESKVCEGLCPRECTFDDDWCGYSHTGQWLKISGNTPSSGTGPSADVSGNGEYAYTEVSGQKKKKTVSVLESPKMDLTGTDQCFSMHYHMSGGDIGSLTVYVVDDTGNSKQVWTLQGSQGNQWKNGSLNIDSTTPFTIRIQAISGNSYRGDIAVDNVILSKTPCVGPTIGPPPSTTAAPITTTGSTVTSTSGPTTTPDPAANRQCRFSNGSDWCGFSHTGLWQIKSGRTSSSNTGPSAGYGGNGFYVYTEVSGKYNRLSELTSRLFYPTGISQCFSMKYHMYGTNIGSLKVYAGSVLMRSLKGNQGNLWESMSFDVFSATPFNIVIKSVSGNSYRGDIALDNIFLSTTPCAPVVTSTSTPYYTSTLPGSVGPWSSSSPGPVGPWSSSSPGTGGPWSSSSPGTGGPWSSSSPGTGGPWSSPSPATGGPWSSSSPGPATTPSPVHPNSLLNFNISFDGYSMDGMEIVPPYQGALSSPVQWKKMSAINWANHSSLVVDRVSEGGHFLGVSAKEKSDSGRSSMIKTPTIIGAGAQWFEFYYNMWSFNYHKGAKERMGMLQVFVYENGSLPQMVFSESEAYNGAWAYAKIHVDVPVGTSFHLMFNAILGRAPVTIAIDDLKGVPRPGANILGIVPELTDKLLSPSVLSCSFGNKANSTCLWRLDGQFKWRTHNGTTLSEGTGPALPGAVTGNVEHRYVYAEASQPQRQGDNAVMDSPVLVSSKPMCMYFYSSTHGADMGSLKVTVLSMDKDRTRGKQTKDFTAETWSDQWRMNAIQLPVNKIFKVVINATVGNGPAGDIAIDNILAAPGKCVKPNSADIPICDFENGVCPGIRGNFRITNDGPGKNNYFTATRYTQGISKLRIQIDDVDQSGACLRFRYRVRTPTNSRADIWFSVTNNGYMANVIESDALHPVPEGTLWQYFERTLPPRPRKESLGVELAASFHSGPNDVSRIDIDDISMSRTMCHQQYSGAGVGTGQGKGSDVY